MAAPATMRPHLLALSFVPVPPATLGADVPLEVPLPEPEGEWVWREGYGWVQPTPMPAEPVEVEWPATGRAA